MTGLSSRLVLLAAIVVLLPVFTGCGAGLQQPGAGEEDTGYIDPFSFGDEFSTESDPQAGNTVDSEERGSSREGHVNDGAEDAATLRYNRPRSAAIYGYRIQVGGVFDNKEDADRMADFARSELDVPIYVTYEPPFYRVRVGDFRTRDDVVDYLQKMKNIDRRFNDAYWLQTPINTP